LVPPYGANETYRFDPSGSTIGFSVHQFLGTTHGRFTKFNGKIEVDREHPENSSVTAQIRRAQYRYAHQKARRSSAQRRIFNVEKFRRSHSKSRSVKQTGPQSGDILGDLTMPRRDQADHASCEITYTAQRDEPDALGVTVDPITRRDFNLMFAPATETVSGISQTVAINIEIEAKRAE
jgi:polyisoprenoid-binding protein YceI